MSGEQIPNDGGAGTPAPITSETFKTAGVPDTYIKDGNYDLGTIGKDLAELATERTAKAERAKAIPADGKYSFDLPKEFKAPDGAPKDFKWSVSEHKVAAFAPIAKELGLTQAQVSQVVAKWAEADFAENAADAAKNEAFFNAEMGKLGAGAKERLATLHTSLKGAVGDEAAAEIAAGLSSAAAVIALEKLIQAAKGPKQAEKHTNGNGADRPDADKLTGAQMHRLALQEKASRQ